MSNKLSSSNVLPSSLLGSWVADRSDIWQMKFLSDRDLASFANRRGLTIWFDDVRRLWQLGLLRADLVASTGKLPLLGLIEVGSDDQGRYLYADERNPRRRKKGWAGSASNLKALHSGVDFYFHPFRFYVLYHIDRILRLNIHPRQMLVSVERYPKLLDRAISHFQKWSADAEFLDHVCKWNEITALCVATEPCVYERIFNVLKSPAGVDFSEQQRRIREHWKELAKYYQKVGLKTLEDFRQDLCVNAEFLDPNKEVHMILRLMTGRYREKVKGKLGGALQLLTMAETLRLASEDVFRKQLPEEDELGFGYTPPWMKKELYDSSRIIDAEPRVVNEYLRQFGLDYGVRLRWYVEGDTEYGALDSLIGQYSAIELVNLRGSVVEKKTKGVSFRDSLRNDLKAGIFSFVSIDKNNEHYVRALRKSAECDEICGQIYLADPDFEFANFTLPELEEIIWEIAIENGAKTSTRNELHKAISRAESGKELWNSAKRAVPELRTSGKGIYWGEKLMEFAWENREFGEDAMDESKTRPLVEALSAALRSVHADYHGTRKEYQVDPPSLRLVNRTNLNSC